MKMWLCYTDINKVVCCQWPENVFISCHEHIGRCHKVRLSKIYFKCIYSRYLIILLNNAQNSGDICSHGQYTMSSENSKYHSWKLSTRRECEIQWNLGIRDTQGTMKICPEFWGGLISEVHYYVMNRPRDWSRCP